MPLHPVTDETDPRLADYRALTDVALRLRTEPEHGMFIAERALVIARAVRAGYRVRSALVSEKWLPSLAGLLADDVPVYLGSPQVLQDVTGFHVHRGALASVHRRDLPAAANVLAMARRVAVLEDVNTHTNVGLIFRNAAALGVNAVLLSPSCADPLYRRSVRVSMGAVFSVPYARLAPWPQGLKLLRDNGFRVFALAPDAAVDLGGIALDPEDRAAIMLGAEGPGLSAAALTYAIGVRIPMAGGIDSLNVGAAAAVAFWQLRPAGG